MTQEYKRLFYIHDPMCSWCYGFAPVLTDLLSRLPDDLTFTRLLGGLAPDSDQAMPDALQARLQDTWRRIEDRIPGTRFNFDFWRECSPRRSTWPACRAVIVTRELNPMLEQAMIEAIQRAYYRQARNPSDTDTLTGLAEEMGLDGDRFRARLHAPETRAALQEEIAASRRIGADSFPSLRLQLGDAIRPVTVDYLDAGPMLEAIEAILDQ